MDPTTALRMILQRTFARLPELISHWNLHPECAIRYAFIAELMLYAGYKPPGIISGYRSRSKQKCLLENWEYQYRFNGDCSIPASKPACRSWHTVTVAGVPASLAIDLSRNAPDLPIFANLWKRFPYGRDGSAFGDPNHFDVELPLHQPSSICT